MAMLDTTALVDLARRDSAPLHQRVRTAIQALLDRGDTLCTSRINEAEFRVGSEMSRERSHELNRVERVLSGVIILEFTADAAMRYAVIKAALFKQGRPAGDCDTLIASIALANGESLLTRNTRHFRDIPGLITLSY